MPPRPDSRRSASPAAAVGSSRPFAPLAARLRLSAAASASRHANRLRLLDEGSPHEISQSALRTACSWCNSAR